MTYDGVVEHIVRGIEACGIAVLVVGAVLALAGWLVEARDPQQRATAYMRLRRKLARVILLGLEILLLADIILTIVVEPIARQRRHPGDHRRDPDRAELLARGRDRRVLAMEPLASRSAAPSPRRAERS